MMLLFELRAKVTAIYQKYAFWLNLAFRFALTYIAFNRLRTLLPFNAMLSKSTVTLALAAISAVLPPSLMVLVAALYVTGQLISQSMIVGVTVLALFLICYCFFLRFTPKYGAAVIAFPVMQSFGIPYLLPLLLGLFANPLAIVPASCGVVAYYVVRFVKDNPEMVASLKDIKDAEGVYIDFLRELLMNPVMVTTMLILSVVIVTVYLIRRINMDYSFEISIAIGTGVMMLGYIIGDLRYEMGIKIAGMVFMCLICAGITLVIQFFYRVLQYSAAEHVEFEDDDYYYYVKAIPKIKTGAPRRKEKKIFGRRRSDDDDNDDDYEEAAMGLIDYSNRAASEAPGFDRKPRTASEDDDDDEADEFGDVIDVNEFRKSRYGTRVGDGVKQEKQASAKDAVSVTAPIPDKAVRILDEEEEPSTAYDDDEDDDDEEEVIVGFFDGGKSDVAKDKFEDIDDFEDDDDYR